MIDGEEVMGNTVVAGGAVGRRFIRILDSVTEGDGLWGRDGWVRCCCCSSTSC